AHFFTIGQRKGINIGGYSKPLFVIGIDARNNILYVGEGENHPGLYRKGIYVRPGEVHWIRPDMVLPQGQSEEYMVRIRYRQPLVKARLYAKEEGLFIIFDRPQRGVAPGQFAAWYRDDEVIGSGVIDH
ncbi:MAG: aminomethyltransferase beta-barrel domain-containing protein, partial [Bacteroidales bacterium]